MARRTTDLSPQDPFEAVDPLAPAEEFYRHFGGLPVGGRTRRQAGRRGRRKLRRRLVRGG